MQTVKNNLDYWMNKKLSLVGKFQIYSKALASTHVYYSSCWVPFVNCYKNLEKLLQDILWASSSNRKGFHQFALDICCLPQDFGGMGLLDYHKKVISLFTKWIIHALEGMEAWKVLIRHFITFGFLLN